MKFVPTPVTPWCLAAVVLVCLSSPSLGAQARTVTLTYDLENVWLLPDLTHPGQQAQQMTGVFEWTYTVGDFENGTGQFLSYQIPWWGSRTTPTLRSTIETNTIEFTMVGNYHGLGLDVSLRLSPVLSPTQPSPIDTVRSSFDIEVGISHRGHVVSGSVVPRCPTPQNYGSGSAGSGGFVPAITSSGGDTRIGNASFRIDCNQLLGGTPCALLLGSSRAQFPLFGMTILVDRSNWIVHPAQAGGTVGVAGAGTLQIPIPIPTNPILVGTEFDLQLVALDRGSPGGLAAATDGLTIVICQ